MIQLYYDAQHGWEPQDFYALYRYLDRMFSSGKPHRAEEIASLDLKRMTPETRYLMKHLLILQGSFRDTMKRYPNLRGLMGDVKLTGQLVLREPPRGTYDYFTRMGIQL